MSKNKKYEYLSHTADLAIKGYGKNLPELFLNIVQGMYKKITQNYRTKPESHTIEGETTEDILVNFLNELIYIIETEKKVLQKIKFKKIKKGKWEFSALATPLLQEKIEIKAATYHDLKIKKVNNHYEATVVFDI